MRLLVFAKSRYMGKDALIDHYGRLYHLFAKVPTESTSIVYTSYKFDQDFCESSGRVILNRCSILRNFVVGWILKLNGFANKANPSIVMSSSDVFNVLLGSCVAKLYKIPHVVDLYDDYLEFGMARIPGLSILYKKSLKSCGGLVVNSAILANKVQSEFPEKPLLIAQSTIDGGDFFPVAKDISRQFFDLPISKTLVGLCGGLNPKHGIELVFKAIAELNRTRSDITFVIAGNQVPGYDIPELPNVVFLGSLDHSEMNYFYSSLDVCLIQLSDSKFGQYAFPQKAFEIISAGCPVVYAKVGVLPELFSGIKSAGYDPSQLGSLVDAILWQIDNKQVTRMSVPTWGEQATNLYTFLSQNFQ